MRTNVYIDGFNLYYRAVKDTPYKWLDLAMVCQHLLPSHTVNRIRYFTALVQARPNDTQAPQRQQVYLRALRTIPGLTITYGQFRPRLKRRPLAQPIEGLGPTVEILDTEEKGSDVNLATYLLVDGYDGDFEQAVIISNDSDLALPIKMVRDNLRLPIGVVNPNLDPKASIPKELSDAATFTRRLRKKTLRECQFPKTIIDHVGKITRPDTW
ncbi:MAG: NYN domain-containing protein [Dehalococcoidia bacterium]